MASRGRSAQGCERLDAAHGGAQSSRWGWDSAGMWLAPGRPPSVKISRGWCWVGGCSPPWGPWGRSYTMVPLCPGCPQRGAP